MLGLLTRDWWVYAVRGAAAIVFGILALAWPGETLTALVFLFGIYALVDGGSLLVALARGDVLARRHAWATALMGIAGIAAGIAAFAWPGITALTFLYLVAVWAITVGVLEIVSAIELRREIDNEVWMAISGLLSIAFGALLVANPGSGLVSLVWLVGLWAIVSGGANIGFALRLRGLDQDLKAVAQLA
jgi:uncharacterized membrane protein HdeD (DUF308 family)